ncbi:MAG TPA: adenosylcobinamide-GDP ribazoletransferase [Actinobacteria bacterium]|nr:adenosylcobinamide-GDP ribazoletransferase [Actinomycetota bacterium]
MSGLRAAIAFLTRLPIRTPSGTLGAAVAFFPVVGAGVGAAAGLVAAVAVRVAPPLVAGLLAVAVDLAITGALHLDGLADTVDGLAGGGDPERRLEIMQDPAVGTFGAAAVVLALGLEAAWLAEIAAGSLREGPPWLPVAVAAAAGAASRAAMVAELRRGPAAREGLGSAAIAATRWPATLVAFAVGALSALLGLGGLVGLFGAALGGWAVASWARRRIGGLTGDVLGAVTVVARLGFYGAAVAVGSWTW